jgi:hypothetical protein
MPYTVTSRETCFDYIVVPIELHKSICVTYYSGREKIAQN